jgi:hypothetical protein
MQTHTNYRNDSYQKQVYFLVLHPVARNITILNESTTFRNQIMCVLFIIYTALHVSAYKQAIIRYYLTNYKKVKLLNFTLGIH